MTVWSADRRLLSFLLLLCSVESRHSAADGALDLAIGVYHCNGLFLGVLLNYWRVYCWVYSWYLSYSILLTMYLLRAAIVYRLPYRCTVINSTPYLYQTPALPMYVIGPCGSQRVFVPRFWIHQLLSRAESFCSYILRSRGGLKINKIKFKNMEFGKCSSYF